jgi:hypothetical protein
MRNPIARMLAILGALRTRRRRPYVPDGPGSVANSAMSPVSSASEEPPDWRPNPHAARWARWARQAQRERWSGRGLPLLPEEACWGRESERADRGPWETEEPVRAYVLVALGEGAGLG